MIATVSNSDVVNKYCSSVLTGRTVACEALKQAVKRYNNDLARIGEEDFPFEFDYADADKYCRFFPLLRHSKGKWAGKPLMLAPWQVFIFWQLFGWKRLDGTRRFRRLFKTVARKNGKSTCAAAIELLLTFGDKEPGAEVFIGATKLDQAKIIHEEAERMISKSPALMKHAVVTKNNIAFPRTNSFARPLGSDKPFDGLNPSGVIFDEQHAWREHHRPFYETLITGSGSREQPLRVTISTMGTDKSLIFLEELEYGRKVLSGDVVDESILVFIYEIDEGDDPLDESVWEKANPGLNESVSLDFLREQATEALHKPTALRRFTQYHANRNVSSTESPITAQLWDSCLAPLSDWFGAHTVGMGVDLGGRDDLAAYGICARFDMGTVEDESGESKPIYRYETKTKAFIAEDTKRDLTQEPFATWIDQGKLVKSRYVVSELKDSLLEDAQSLGVEFICYDPYQATQLAENLEQEGMKPIKMAQNHGQFNETIKELFSAISESRFNADELDVVLRWAALNLAINRNNRDQVMPDKAHARDKIDPFVSMLMAMRAATFAPPRFGGKLYFSG